MEDELREFMQEMRNRMTGLEGQTNHVYVLHNELIQLNMNFQMVVQNVQALMSMLDGLQKQVNDYEMGRDSYDQDFAEIKDHFATVLEGIYAAQDLILALEGPNQRAPRGTYNSTSSY